MTRPELQDKIYFYLKDNPHQTATEIARAVNANVASVSSTLTKMFKKHQLIKSSELGVRGGHKYLIVPRQYKGTVWILDAMSEVIEGDAAIRRIIMTINADSKGQFEGKAMDTVSRSVDDVFWFGPITRVL